MTQEQKVREPEYNDVWMLLDTKAGRLLPLECQTANTKLKIRALGFGGASSVAGVKGDKSPVGTADVKPQFIVRLKSDGTDPATQIEFYLFNVQKDERCIVTTRAKLFKGSGGGILSGGRLRRYTND